MKKDSIAKKNAEALTKNDKKGIRRKANHQRLTVGLDLGDRTCRYCILDEAGEIVSEGSLPMTRGGLAGLFGNMARCRVAMEVGTHSPWVSRHVAAMGHEVIVANPHKVKLITQSTKKNDRVDAEKLARLARVDPQLLSPIRHRSEEAQADLAVIRGRATLVEARTCVINSARGLVKPMGERLEGCDADQAGEKLGKGLKAGLQEIVGPLLKSAEALSEQIGEYDGKIELIAKRYPEVELLQQVYGVGILTSLTFLLTIEDAGRFQHSRDVGAFVGLQPRQRESGDSKAELGISKTGDGLLRRYLVQAAQCVLRKGSPDSDLKRWGMSKAKGGKGAKRRAVVGVARKLAVLLHRLWVTGEVYDPEYNRKAAAVAEGKKGKAAA